MSTDYFRRGGKECAQLRWQALPDRLGEHLVNGDRLLAYKLRDTWKEGKSIVNPKKLAKDMPFINASRQYLTVNTPLKDLMFRHTRDTLRQYYKLGILDRDIPRRIVSDNAIDNCIKAVPVVERSCFCLSFRSYRDSGDRSIHFVNWLIFFDSDIAFLGLMRYSNSNE